ncbi:myosin light chain kinase family member 4 [Apteryx mantelli]|uniref:Myosin light chain kinase family member 4 n=1 Tax=Apteryx mantelli TaxID=2696672 RepID=A0ABM4E6B9_9AVES
MERKKDSNITEHSMKLLKINRLEEINARYNSNRLEKTSFFQSMEKMERTRSFQEEKFSESNAGTEDEEVIKESETGTNSTKEQKPPDSTEGAIQKSQSCSHKVHKLNKENAEKASSVLLQMDSAKFCTEGPKKKGESLAFESYYNCRRSSIQKSFTTEKQQEDAVDDGCQRVTGQEIESESLAGGKRKEKYQVSEDERQEEREDEEEGGAGENEEEDDEPPAALQNEDEAGESHSQEAPQERCKGCEKGTGNYSSVTEQTCHFEHSSSSKHRVNAEGLNKDDNKKSRLDAENADGICKTKKALTGRVPKGRNKMVNSTDDNLTPPAPFDHRIVSAKRAGISSYYNVSKNEILGGGRFGQVHKCEEKATGLKLAAKIIKAKGDKQKDEVKNEINVMNQLNHVNLIQLYDAFESKNDIVLVMEYVEGGELFDRIIDENYNLTELDTILFIKQICEGIQYMHQMYILHLDLKPENILCVNRAANQIKIIDFGLARRYKPREKLRVNFGTPEFLAPEVVNYEFVSFPTDMWSVGVIAYMLLSGLSPFLGDDNNETLNNILACSWNFEDEEFQDVSDEAKDFISKLLIKEKWNQRRIKVAVCLQHPWLNNFSERAAKQKKSCCVVTAAKRFENISSLGALAACHDPDFY